VVRNSESNTTTRSVARPNKATTKLLNTGPRCKTKWFWVVLDWGLCPAVNIAYIHLIRIWRVERDIDGRGALDLCRATANLENC